MLHAGQTIFSGITNFLNLGQSLIATKRYIVLRC